MAFSQDQLLTLAGVLAILFGVIVYNNVMALRGKGRVAGTAPFTPPEPKPAAAAADAPMVDPLLVKFAHHEGSVVGETVAIDGDKLILKQAGTFKSVPKAQAEVKSDEVVLTGPIDWTQAEIDGAAWYAAKRSEADPAVSGPLTRSEDVKAPALESTKR